VVALQGKANLLEIVRAVRTTRCLASGLDGRQQKRDENANNRNDNQ
jgi:hypothetical protein